MRFDERTHGAGIVGYLVVYFKFDNPVNPV